MLAGLLSQLICSLTCKRLCVQNFYHLTEKSVVGASDGSGTLASFFSSLSGFLDGALIDRLQSRANECKI